MYTNSLSPEVISFVTIQLYKHQSQFMETRDGHLRTLYEQRTCFLANIYQVTYKHVWHYSIKCEMCIYSFSLAAHIEETPDLLF